MILLYSYRPLSPYFHTSYYHSGISAGFCCCSALAFLIAIRQKKHDEQGSQYPPMLQQEFNFRSLMVQDEAGQYRLATGAEIIEA